VEDCWFYLSDLNPVESDVYTHRTSKKQLNETIISINDPIIRVVFTALFLGMQLRGRVYTCVLSLSERVCICADTVIPINNLTSRCLLTESRCVYRRT
jgi:hypothetical protein